MQHLLPRVHIVHLHPKDAEYDEEMYRLNMCDDCLEGSQYVEPEIEPAQQQLLVPPTPQPAAAAPFRFGQPASATAFAVGLSTSLIGIRLPLNCLAFNVLHCLCVLVYDVAGEQHLRCSSANLDQLFIAAG